MGRRRPHPARRAAEKTSTKDGHRRRRLAASYCTQSTLSGSNEYEYSVSADGGDITGTATLYAKYGSYSGLTGELEPDGDFCFEFSLTDSSKFLLGRCSFLLASCFLLLASCLLVGLSCYSLLPTMRGTRDIFFLPIFCVLFVWQRYQRTYQRVPFLWTLGLCRASDARLATS